MKMIIKMANRSAWDKGVNKYVEELLENYNSMGREATSKEEVKKFLLNGAKDWRDYSWGGCSLIYSVDIAQRLCTNSELERTLGGLRRPSKNEDWLDVQARALRQAAILITQNWITLNK